MQEIFRELDSIEIVNALPCIKEKFIVDFANGIEVVKDHIRYQQKSNSSFFSRIYDSLIGVNAKRQAEINRRINDGNFGALEFLVYLAKHNAKSQLTITRVNENIAEICEGIEDLFIRNDKLKKQFENFRIEIANRIEQLEHQISRLNANDQIGQVIDKWTAGKFANFSLAGRLYICLEELYWGSFGDFVRQNPSEKDSLIERLKNKVIIQLKADAREKFNEIGRMDVSCWFSRPEIAFKNDEAFEAMKYLADSYQSGSQPFIHYLVNQDKEPSKKVPLIFDSIRLAEAIVSEIFQQKG